MSWVKMFVSASSLNRSTAKDGVLVIKIKIIKGIRNRIFIACIDSYQIRDFVSCLYQMLIKNKIKGKTKNQIVAV